MITEIFRTLVNGINLTGIAVTRYEESENAYNLIGEHRTYLNYVYTFESRSLDIECEDTLKAIDNIVEDVEDYCNMNNFVLYMY
jgi:hypothetical protein